MNEDRDAYIGSRDYILERSWVTELWMRVIQKAIDDLALFTRMYEDKEKISEEEWGYAETAHGFLFDPDYVIDIDGKDVSLADLLDNWGCEDVVGWRTKTSKRVRQLVIEKRKTLQTRRNKEDASRHRSNARSDGVHKRSVRAKRDISGE